MSIIEQLSVSDMFVMQLGWLYVSFLTLFSPVCQAVLVNRTIDDFFGDPVTGFKPVYLPPGAWSDQTCSKCAVQLDAKSAFGGTWTAATYNPGMNSMNITLEFTGVAIWVFFILTNVNDNGSSIVTNTHCDFTLDGQYAGNFSHLGDVNNLETQYDAISFSRSGLANTTHQLVILTNDYPYNVSVAFDYAIYTVDMDGPSLDSSLPPKSPQMVLLASRSLSSSMQNVGGTVASVLGGFALFTILVSSFLIWRLSQRKGVNYRPVQNATDRHPVPWQHSSSEQLGTSRPIPRTGTLHIDAGSPYSSSMDGAELPSSGTSLTHPIQEKLRIIRQREINDRLQLAQREMSSLSTQISPVEGSSRTGQEMASLREQVQELRDQIEHLQTQRGSNWALGLTDEQPPAYM